MIKQANPMTSMINQVVMDKIKRLGASGAGTGGGLGALLGAGAGGLYGGLRDKKDDESRLWAVLKGMMGGGAIGGLGGAGIGAATNIYANRGLSPEQEALITKPGPDGPKKWEPQEMPGDDKPPSGEMEVGASDRYLRKQAALVIIKVASAKLRGRERRAAVTCLSRYLTKVAMSLYPRQRAPFLRIQSAVQSGQPLWRAVQIGFPKMAGERRHVITQRLVKGAADEAGMIGEQNAAAPAVPDLGSQSPTPNVPVQEPQSFTGTPQAASDQFGKGAFL